MKIRTDFVTNSSSSSFTIMICAKDKNGDRFVSKTATSRKKMEKKRDKYSDINYSDVSSIKGVFDLLADIGVAGQARSNLGRFISQGEVEKIDISLIWDSHGESSGCTVANDSKLERLAQALLDSAPGEKAKATTDFVNYLTQENISVVGGWVDETWPVGFLGSRDEEARYGWSEYADNIEKLANLIIQHKYDNDDIGIETFKIDLKNKNVSHISELLIDGSRRVLKMISKTTKKKEVVKAIEPIEIVTCEKGPDIDLGEYKFSYKDIDQIPQEFILPIFKEDGSICSFKDSKVNIGNFCVSLQLKEAAGELAKEYSNLNIEWYDPLKVMATASQPHVFSVYPRKDFLRISDEQMKHRIAVFLRLMQLCTNVEVIKKIVEEFPKKKNQLLYKGRVEKIGWLFAVDLRDEMDFNIKLEHTRYYLYQLYAKAIDDTNMTISVRFADPFKVIDFENCDDLATKNNLFSCLN